MRNRLTQLLASNKNQTPMMKRAVQNASDSEPIYIYGAIVMDEETAQWWGGVAAETIVPQIRAAKGETLHLYINSPGGDVFAGQAIAQAIRDTGVKVIAHVDGYAASAATVIANAADEIEMAEGGFYMIHNAWTYAIGNRHDLKETAGLLEKIDGSLAAQYAKRSGKDLADIAAAMDAETWYTAQEAIDAGLVDRIAEGVKAKASWDLSAYAKAPKVENEPDENLATEEHRARQHQRISMLSRIQVS